MAAVVLIEKSVKRDLTADRRVLVPQLVSQCC